MGVGSGGQGGRALWIFMHGTHKVEGGFMLLFFGLVFFVVPLTTENFSADALDRTHFMVIYCLKTELNKYSVNRKGIC